MSRKKLEGFWNGKPVEYEVLMVKVTNRLEGGMPWCKPFVGEERQAVKVMIPRERPIYIDNEDGSGLVKVLMGGVSEIPHRSLGDPIEVSKVPKQHWVMEIDETAAERTQKDSDDYWENKNPEEFKKRQHLRNNGHGVKRHGNPNKKPKSDD